MTEVFRESSAQSGLVSIVVPVYNVDEYLRECIDSLLRQSYENLQIVLVDDGSTDSSGSLCDEYSLLDNRVVVMHTANGGLSAARNAGLGLAAGEYICFVDSDDWVSDDFVQSLVSELKANDAQIAVCSFVLEYADKSIRHGFTCSRFQLDGPAALYGLYGPDYLGLTVVWNKLYERGLFDSARFAVGMVHEDEEIILRLFDSITRIACFDVALYHYRQRGGSITQKGVTRQSMDKVVAYERRLEYLQRCHPNAELVLLTRSRIIRILLKLQAEIQRQGGRSDGLILLPEVLALLEKHARCTSSPNSPLTAWARLTTRLPRLTGLCYAAYLQFKGAAGRVAFLRRVRRRSCWELRSR